VLCAAGADKLVLIVRDQNLVQRWDLRTLQKELTATLPTVTQIDSAVAGYASAGPLMLVTRNGPKFLDFATLKPVEIKEEQSSAFNGYWHSGQLEARASADGSTFAAWALNSSPSGIRILTLEGNTARASYEHNSAGALIPSYDGSLLFTTAGGIYSSDLKPVVAEQFRGSTCLPSYHPSYFLAIRYGAESGSPRSKPGNCATVSVYTTLDKRLLITLPEFSEVSRGQQYGFRPEGLPVEKRIHFFPSANLILTVGDTRDQLVLRRFVVTDALDKAGIDYLFVASTPPRVALKGQPYTYQPDVKSKRGGVKVSLDSGPEGMTIDGSGSLHWNVPDSFAGASAGVILSVKDASGQEIYHTFNVAVR
jgi:hypothetical protein